MACRGVGVASAGVGQRPSGSGGEDEAGPQTYEISPYKCATGAVV